jgi:hypothetical protein
LDHCAAGFAGLALIILTIVPISINWIGRLVFFVILAISIELIELVNLYFCNFDNLGSTNWIGRLVFL